MSDRPQGPLPSAQLSVPLLLQQLPPASCVTATSWPEVLRTVCYLLPICKPTDGAGGGADVTSAAVEGLAKLPYEELPPAHKLALLRLLVQAVLELGEAGPANDRKTLVDLILKDHVDRAAKFDRERREAETAARRDCQATLQMIEQRKSQRMAEATMTVPSDVAAAHWHAKEQANLLLQSGRGGGLPKGSAAAAAAAAAAARLCVSFSACCLRCARLCASVRVAARARSDARAALILPLSLSSSRARAAAAAWASFHTLASDSARACLSLISSARSLISRLCLASSAS